MKRKLSLFVVLTLLCTMFAMPVSAAEASSLLSSGSWKVSIITQGTVTTVTGTLKVNYSYSF